MRVPIAYLLTLLTFCPYALHPIAILFANENPTLTTAPDTLQSFDKPVLVGTRSNEHLHSSGLVSRRQTGKGNPEETGGN